MRSHVVILNGVSSVGKSSTAKALQRIAERPFLHLSLDMFLEMLPERTLNHPDGVTFKALENVDPPQVAITTGVTVQNALRGMRHAVAALARQGNNLIVDDVMFEQGEDQEYRTLLADNDAWLVGLFASLPTLEARERARGDRDIGLARWQFERVHQGRRYDLELDAEAKSPQACAQAIKAEFKL